MNKPTDELLQAYAPLEAWREAEKQACRSPHKQHKTGAVIFCWMTSKTRWPYDIYSTGCAHPHDGGRKSRSTHAEQHAISRLPNSYVGAACLIVTLTKNGNYATCSRPCKGCASSLEKFCWRVIYVEKCNDGTWAVRSTSPKELSRGYLIPTKENK